MLTAGQEKARYTWPTSQLDSNSGWSRAADGSLWRELPELRSSVAEDSRWPAFFPSALCLVTTGGGEEAALEKVVGASIVNRFPYIVALSFCREELSARHYARSRFCDLLERSGVASVQFIAPGPQLDAAMGSIAATGDGEATERIAKSGLETRPATSHAAPVFEDAYMVYEARLVEPTTDYRGEALFEKPWVDVGSHRIYFLEITVIQMREDIAEGTSQIRWRSLPAFAPDAGTVGGQATARLPESGYRKPYTPNYRFPSSGTIKFQSDRVENGMAIRELDSEIVWDNDSARWPCFFPQSAGIITSRGGDGAGNVMPCGSTTVVSRHPLVIAPCISYASVNERYAPRASLDLIRESGWFGCGVPYIDDLVLDAIRYAGNVSLAADPEKLRNSGLASENGSRVPVLTDFPVFFECEVVDAVQLGTHVMYFGEVRRIRLRPDLSPANPLEWCPWPDVTPAS